MLDGVKVSYYGTPTPLTGVATLSVPEPRMITIKPWDKSAIKDIEKAIKEANLGLNPMNDGEFIRLPIPPLTEERRKEITKVLRHDAENARVAVRNVRRDVMNEIKHKKDKHLSQDEERRAETDIQKLTDKHVADIDAALAAKEKEVMQV